MLQRAKGGGKHRATSSDPSVSSSWTVGRMLDVDQCSSMALPTCRAPSPASLPTRFRLSNVPLIELKQSSNSTNDVGEAEPMELLRKSFSGRLPHGSTDSSSSGKGGICSMSDTMESLRGTAPLPQPSVRIRHITRSSMDGSSRFPKLDECAHFHYENVELGTIKVAHTVLNGADKENEPSQLWFCIQVNSSGRTWTVRRSYENFCMFDHQLHRCVYDRKYSLLKEIPTAENISKKEQEEVLRTMLSEYLERFSQLACNLINCGPVLNWLELDNRGNRLIVTDEAAINTPAVAAAYVTKRYTAQASDEISFEVGDMISVIDMPPPEESTWWRGKKGFEVGFFPCECVEVIGDQVPHGLKIPKAPTKPVLRKHGKLIAFFRSFLLSRPSRRKLKQSGILKERVFGCDLGEHLMNTGRDIPLVLTCCAEFIEQHGIVDGIYRLSGVTSNIQKLRLAFDEDRAPDLNDEAILQDIHCVASLLKMYFRELPNPLLTYQLYDKFVSAVQSEEDVRLLQLRDVVQQLPPPHYRTLEYLMKHLARVAAHGNQTGMTPKNVAIVWAPNLLRSKDLEGGGVGALHVVGVQAILTEYLIRYADLIFNEKMPIFQSAGSVEDTPRRTRPKSLAISTPTKLLSLEEARSRALSANLPPTQQKYIDVGGGPDNLPAKYHTVIDLPLSKRGGSKLKKSPSGWKSFFSRGWHSGSAREKERTRAGVRKISTSSLEHSSLPSQVHRKEKAVTEADVSHTCSKKLRSVKSAESLISSTGNSCRNSRVLDILSPVDASRTPSRQASEESQPPDVTSPTKSPNVHKHIRSISHDSYFEHNEHNIPLEEEQEMDDGSSVQLDIHSDGGLFMCGSTKFRMKELCTNMETDTGWPTAFERSSSDDALFDASKVGSDGLPYSQKGSRKQKFQSSDSEGGSPKVQKLSQKRFRASTGSPTMMRRKSDSLSSSGGKPGSSKGSSPLLTRSKNVISDQTLLSDSVERPHSTVETSTTSIKHASFDSTLPDQSLSEGVIKVEENTTSASSFLEGEAQPSSAEKEGAAATLASSLSSSSSSSNVTNSRIVVERYGNEETVIVEVHATQESSDEDEPNLPMPSYEKDATVKKSSSSPAEKKLLETNLDEVDVVGDDRRSSFADSDTQDQRVSASMEATLSDSLSLSQLQSFDIPDDSVFSESLMQDNFDSHFMSELSSLMTTPDSPTMANVSELTSSTTEDADDSPDNHHNIHFEAKGNLILHPGDDMQPLLSLSEDPHKALKCGNEDESPWAIDIEPDDVGTPSVEDDGPPYTRLDTDGDKTPVSDGDVLGRSQDSTPEISPINDWEREGKPNSVTHHTAPLVSPESEVVLGSDQSEQDEHLQSANLLSPDMSNYDTNNHSIQTSLEASLTDIDASESPEVTSPLTNTVISEITPKEPNAATGKTTETPGKSQQKETVASTESPVSPLEQYTQERSSDSTLSSSVSSKKRLLLDQISPISPLEESRRKFESEIGRSIVRDRQMRLEMEQIHSEGQQRALLKRDGSFNQHDLSKDLLSSQKAATPKSEDSKSEERKMLDGVELRHSATRQALDTQERKRNSEPETATSHGRSDAAVSLEAKRLSEPIMTQIQPKYKMEKKASVKELLSKFEPSSPRGDDVIQSTQMPEKRHSAPPEDVQGRPKSSHQPSLFTQLKVMKLQALHPSSVEVVPSDPWSDPILDAVQDQPLLPPPSEPPALFKNEPDSCEPPQKAASSHSHAPSPRPQTLAFGKPPKHPGYSVLAAEGGRDSSSRSSLKSSQNLRQSSAYGQKAGEELPDMPQESSTSNTRSYVRHSKDIEESSSSRVAKVADSSPATTPVEEVPARDTKSPVSLTTDDCDATRRERIDKYKEERRAQLREKLRSESFKLEAEEKERVQNEFRARRQVKSTSPTSETVESDSSRRLTSPRRSSRKGSHTSTSPESDKHLLSATVTDIKIVDTVQKETAINKTSAQKGKLSRVGDECLSSRGMKKETNKELPAKDAVHSTVRWPGGDDSVTSSSVHSGESRRTQAAHRSSLKSPLRETAKTKAAFASSSSEQHCDLTDAPLSTRSLTERVQEGTKSSHETSRTVFSGLAEEAQAPKLHVEGATKSVQRTQRIPSPPKRIRDRAAVFERSQEDSCRSSQSSTKLVRQQNASCR